MENRAGRKGSAKTNSEVTKMGSLIGAVAVIASSALGGAITHGLFGSLAIKKSSRKMNVWGAGAIAGVTVGALAAAMMLAKGGSMRGLGNLTVNQLPSSIGVLTAQKLNGVHFNPTATRGVLFQPAR